jgi:hypothetical protein
MVVKIEDATPGEVSPWHMLGYLTSTLDHKGRITKTDWNEARQAAAAEQQRSDAALEQYRAELRPEPAAPVVECGEYVPRCLEAGQHAPTCRCRRPIGHDGVHSSSLD